jgi:hypothetical protein
MSNRPNQGITKWLNDKEDKKARATNIVTLYGNT